MGVKLIVRNCLIQTRPGGKEPVDPLGNPFFLRYLSMPIEDYLEGRATGFPDLRTMLQSLLRQVPTVDEMALIISGEPHIVLSHCPLRPNSLIGPDTFELEQYAIVPIEHALRAPDDTD